MLSKLRLNKLIDTSLKQFSNLRNNSYSAFISSSQFNKQPFIGIEIEKNEDLVKKDPFKPNFNQQIYKCPSIKSFQLPINDFKITDILKRHELNLPEINKNKLIEDPLLIFQIERELPEYQKQSSPMHCGKPLYGDIKWRKRMMNIKKRKKYQKKMFYVFQNRTQNREKRFQNICEMFRKINEKKTEIFDPIRYIHRELEKAKFYGYECNTLYTDYRKIIEENMKSFDEKYTRKFVNPKIPIHILNSDLDPTKHKVAGVKKVSLISKDKK